MPFKKINIPASFVVSISSYSSRILSSRSFSSLSQIIPTCRRENKGCSFLVGDEAPEDIPVRRVKNHTINTTFMTLYTETALQCGHAHIEEDITLKLNRLTLMPSSRYGNIFMFLIYLRYLVYTAPWSISPSDFSTE